MVVDLRNEARQVLDDMKWLLVDVDEEKRLLEEIVGRYVMTGQGNACVVIGKHFSGRTTTVRSVVTKFGLSAKLHVISVAQLGSDKNAMKLLMDEDYTEDCLLIIEDADELATRQRQTLLYLLLDTIRNDCNRQWLVFLMVQNQTDSSYALLKRITSVFLCLYLTDEKTRPAYELLTEAVGMVMPREHSLERIIRYFRRIGNTVDSRVRVTSDLSVYKELDRLVELGILVADPKANNMAFRRCSLNVHTKTLDKILRGIKLPASIEYWFDTQPAE
uniref:ATPase_AAA_core domain-containing protein n=1 Tax=Angiostrongylus cantonensis TaxID=6313 RepID=A0A0K0CVU4_ANGCA